MTFTVDFLNSSVFSGSVWEESGLKQLGMCGAPVWCTCVCACVLACFLYTFVDVKGHLVESNMFILVL
jgi:hypothetical protein